MSTDSNGTFRSFTSEDLSESNGKKKRRVIRQTKDWSQSAEYGSIPDYFQLMKKGYKSHVDGCNASSSLSQTKRTPLCNITNTSANIQKFKPFTSEDLNVRDVDKKTRKCGRIVQAKEKSLSKKTVPYLTRKLFDVVDVSQLSDRCDYEDIEQSAIVGENFGDDFLCGSDTDSIDSDHADYSDDFVHAKGTVPEEYATLGPPSAKCQHCDAFMWKEERCNKNVTKGIPIFSICCKKGQIVLPKNPRTPSYLWQLYNDPLKGKNFKKCSRIYNSIFAFISTGGKVDHLINNGRGPYVYRLNGQNHHVFGSLIPDDGTSPKFCQLYIYDTENELSNRMRWVDLNDDHNVDSEIVENLMRMFDEKNELVKRFRIARDRYKESGIVDLEIVLKVCCAENGRENNIGPSDEVAGIMIGDQEETEECRDIVIQAKSGKFQRVTNVHPKLIALQYPLLFPTGEDGYHKDIEYAQTSENRGKTRHKCSMKDFYCYRLHVRHNQGMSARLGGRLFQQYIVDAFSTIEQARLWWFRTHQTTLRNELYNHIADVLREGDSDTENVGKSVILPAGFVGSKRYMQQNFQDALAVFRHIGHPDIFLTMTCNPTCDEILEMMKLIPNGSPYDSPDIIARVFHLKLQ